MQNDECRTQNPESKTSGCRRSRLLFCIQRSAFCISHPRSSREIGLIALQQRIHVRGEEIDLAVDLFRLARLEAADAEVAVEAGDHALEQLLARLEGDGADHLVVGGEAADQ